MQLPYRSLQPPNAEGAGSDSKPVRNPSPKPRYQVTGLAKADTMPIDFGGQVYDLANLTDEQLAYLRQFPDQVPYLR